MMVNSTCSSVSYCRLTCTGIPLSRQSKARKVHAPFPFFKLPWEIRVMILELYLTSPNYDIRRRNKNRRFLETFPHRHMQAEIWLNMPLLSVNHQMHEEAAFVLYGMNRFRFHLSNCWIDNVKADRAMQNTITSIAPRYWRLLRDITIKVHVKCYRDGIPRERYLMIQSALETFAAALTTGHSLVKITIIYLEHTSDLPRLDHSVGDWELKDIQDSHDGAPSCFKAHKPLGWEGCDQKADAVRSAPVTDTYHKVLEPLGLIFGVRTVHISGGNEDFNQRLTRAIQSPHRICEPVPVSEIPKGRGRERKLAEGRKWYESKYDFLFDAPAGKEQRSGGGVSSTL